MNLIEEIVGCRSISVVGLDKNTGKTESLNWILSRLDELGVRAGVTSIGVDGECKDQVFSTHKPEIELSEGTLFATSESHYLSRRLGSEVVAMPDIRTSMGRLVVGNVVERGKVILSGAPDTASTREMISLMNQLGARTVLVDGALGRRSTASPAVTEGMILATGAAVSANLATMVAKTLYVCRQISLPLWSENIWSEDIKGVRFLDTISGETAAPDVDSAVALKTLDNSWFERYDTMFVSGAVTDGVMERVSASIGSRGFRLVIPDFTRLFVDQRVMDRFESSGGEIYVQHRPRLLAVTVNPTSPSGYRFDSSLAVGRLAEKLECNVFDVRTLC